MLIKIWRGIFKWRKKWKGKEYIYVKLKFEGEYINGERSGYRIEYDN